MYMTNLSTLKWVLTPGVIKMYLQNIVDADALVLKHQVNSIHNTNPMLIVQVQFHKKCSYWPEHTGLRKFIWKKIFPDI